nr:MAG TPA: hypothetical protein [Caudoviricetes sp.]
MKPERTSFRKDGVLLLGGRKSRVDCRMGG